MLNVDQRDRWIEKHFKVCEAAPGYDGVYCPNCKQTIHVAHIIMPNREGRRVDHKNGGTRDNRRENLRYATQGQNVQNSPGRASGLPKGVKVARDGRYEARIIYNYKYKHLGTFDTIIDAIRAYNKSAVELFGEHAYTTKEEEWS